MYEIGLWADSIVESGNDIMVLQNADIYLVSDLTPEFVRSIFMKPFSTVQEAYDAAARKLGGAASVIVMPYGGSTLPVERRAQNG